MKLTMETWVQVWWRLADLVRSSLLPLGEIYMGLSVFKAAKFDLYFVC